MPKLTRLFVLTVALCALFQAAPAFATCVGDAPDGVLDVGEDCDLLVPVPGDCCSDDTSGVNACTFETDSYTCRPSVGPCDLDDKCTGGSETCPADAKSTGECRSSAGVCDVAETCNGIDDGCPNDDKSEAECRASAGVCDVAETCDGIGDDCPTDAKSTAECRASAGACDLAETCDGVSDDCGIDAKSTAECRASAGVCDLAETCDGVSDDCGIDAKSTAECRESGGVCDLAETCDGASDDCPTDAKSTAECRASAGVCDPAETCDGATNTCGADAKSTAACRPSAGICDPTETCDGVADGCPAESFSATSVTCRTAVTACDQTEMCTGTSAGCPVDAAAPLDTSCGSSSSDTCDQADSCDGSGNCRPNHRPDGTSCNDNAYCNGADTCGGGTCSIHAGNPCPGPDDDNNCAESCDEGSDSCTGADPNGSACDLADDCTDGSTCTAGTCGGGDSTRCLCGDEPLTTGCLAAGKFQIAIKDTGDVAKNSIKWKWGRGVPVNPALLGTPTTTTSYAFCIYDRTGNVPVKVAAYGLPPNPVWDSSVGSIKYSDKTGLHDGIASIKGKAEPDPGKSSMAVRVAGANLVMPPTFNSVEFFDQDPSVTVQLVNSSGGCWTSDFTAAKLNTDLSFLSKGP